MTRPPSAARLALGLVLTAAVARTATAGEVDVALGADAAASEWQEGAIAMGTLELGYAFERLPWLQLAFVSRHGYADVDQRKLGYLAFGVELHHPLGPTRPYLRVGLAHQHEQPVVTEAHQPWQSLLGVADGIRHRGGVDAALGVEVPFRSLSAGDLYGAAQVMATWFGDPRGPAWYVAGGVAVGLRWDFARSR